MLLNKYHLRIISLLFLFTGISVHAKGHAQNTITVGVPDHSLKTLPVWYPLQTITSAHKIAHIPATELKQSGNYLQEPEPAGGLLPEYPQSAVRLTIATFSPDIKITPTDTVHLEEVRVEATRLYLDDRLHAVRIYRTDSTLIQRYNGSPLSDLFENELPVIVRNYGPAGISSISVRGFGPGQTQILWEGIPVNHPMVGQTDLALYPSSAFTHIEFVPGNSAAAYGSGSIAGTVHLGSGSSGREATVTRTYGDFGLSRTGIGITEVTGPYTISMTASGYTADNDYGYFDRLRQRQAKRDNADKEAFSLTAKAGYQSGSWNAGSALWSGFGRGGVPGSVAAGQTAARQEDNWLRWAANAGYRSGTTRYYTHAYFSRHNLDYLDSRSRIDSRSLSSSGGLTAGLTGYIGNRVTLNALLQGGRQWIDTNNYEQVENRSYGAVSMTGIIELPAGLRIFPGLRVDFYSDFGWAMSPSIGLNLELLDRLLVLRVQYSNDFNAPSMNDLFWSPGGNPGLDPERGVNMEAGASMTWKYRSSFLISTDVTVYRTTFSDGIVWSPVSGSVWSPSNVQGLEAGGFELNQELSFRFHGFSLDVANMWLKAGITSNTPRFVGDPSTGRQRPYIPDQTLKTSITLRHRSFSLFANRVYTGRRFTTADHSSPLDPLDPYTVVNAGVSVTVGWRNFYTTARLTIRNLMDEEYEVIAWYPMPARNREAGITIGYRP